MKLNGLRWNKKQNKTKQVIAWWLSTQEASWENFWHTAFTDNHFTNDWNMFFLMIYTGSYMVFWKWAGITFAGSHVRCCQNKRMRSCETLVRILGKKRYFKHTSILLFYNFFFVLHVFMAILWVSQAQLPARPITWLGSVPNNQIINSWKMHSSSPNHNPRVNNKIFSIIPSSFFCDIPALK